MKILVCQRRMAGSPVGYPYQYVNCGVITGMYRSEEGLKVDVERVPFDVYARLVPLLMEKGFEGRLECREEAFTSNPLLDDPLERVSVFTYDGREFKYRPILKRGQRIGRVQR
jgi:hypothetical protein